MVDRDAPRRRTGDHTVAARAALAELERPPRGALRAIALLVAIRYRAVRQSASVGEPSVATGYRNPADLTTRERAIAPPAIVHAARSLAFQHLGVYAFAGYFTMIPRDAWVSSDQRTRLSVKRDGAKGGEGRMRPYILSTMFDDGTGIETYGAAAPEWVPSSERIFVHGGTGDLEVDFPHHARKVDDYLDAHPSARALRCESLADSVAMSLTFDTRLQPDRTLVFMIADRALVYGVVVASIASLLWTLARFAP